MEEPTYRPPPSPPSARRVLFLTWDGPGTDYLSALFLPAFEGVRLATGTRFDVFQHGWGDGERQARLRGAVPERGGGEFFHRGVWRGHVSAGTAAAILRGAADLARLARRLRADVIMPRSVIPAAMTALAWPWLGRASLLYDADGLMADERVDFMGWDRNGAPYRLLSAAERWAVRHSGAVLTRTARARAILAARTGVPEERFVLLPNGRDGERFTPGTSDGRGGVRASLGGGDRPLVAYAGSAGPQYHPARMLAFFRRVLDRRPDSLLLLLLTEHADAVRREAQAQGLPSTSILIRSVQPEEVPAFLAAADLGLAFRAPTFSQQAVAPVKVGEYLLCGLPVLGTTGIGDLDAQIDEGVGRLLPGLEDASLEAAAAWFVTDVLADREAYRARARRRGEEGFGLTAAVAAYREALARISPPTGPAR